MRIKTILGCSLLGLVTLFVPNISHAKSSAAFYPYTWADGPYIGRTQWGVFNTDFSGAHSVTADIGDQQSLSAGAVVGPQVYVYSPGSAITCTTYAMNSTTFATYTGTPATTSTFGTRYIASAVTVVTGGNYFISVVCTLGASNSTYGNATVFGTIPGP